MKSGMSELEQALEASRVYAPAGDRGVTLICSQPRKCGVRRRHPPQLRAQDNLREEPHTDTYAESGNSRCTPQYGQSIEEGAANR